MARARQPPAPDIRGSAAAGSTQCVPSTQCFLMETHRPVYKPSESRFGFKPSAQTVFLIAVLVGSVLFIGYLLLFYGNDGMAGDPPRVASRLKLSDIPFNGARAYDYLKELCAIGPRFSGSPGMEAQQKLLADHFSKLGATVEWQPFRYRHPQTGAPVNMANLIIHWHPDRKQRVLLCTHYDTRPFPDRDRENPRGRFVGANDGASGAAILMELGRDMPAVSGTLGVDFVLFDGEELVYDENDRYFLGSEWFARNYAAEAESRAYRYRWAVLLDMVGDADLRILPDRESLSWADSKPLISDLWDTAQRLGVREFINRPGHEIRDDHLNLHNMAGIPSCDLIDFDYPAWHTAGDTPDKCSALSLAKVGWVVEEWLKGAVKKP